MKTTLCEMTVSALLSFGIRRAVVSPGARCAPLLQAAADSGMMLTAVADERVAAFCALGMSGALGEPVALMCTSGSALLNYAPALAEAFYRHIPLIVISADRPEVWIDRTDSQTIRQPGALEAVTGLSVSLPAQSSRDAARLARLRLSEALIKATGWPGTPVHINLPVDFADTPLEAPAFHPVISTPIEPGLSNELLRELIAPWRSKRILIVAGGTPPSPGLNRALTRLAAFENIAVVTEPAANVGSPRFIRSIDPIVAARGDELRPDLVITFGDPVVSAPLKHLLRTTAVTHWAAGPLPGATSAMPDTFGVLERIFDCPPALFFARMAAAMEWRERSAVTTDRPPVYADLWHKPTGLREALDALPWCSTSAMDIILGKTPRQWNIHSSNGLTIRILALLDSLHGHYHRVSCNRGVSGIDGSTSTALGESLVSSAPTLLLSGDISALYDIGALASGLPDGRFRMVVFDNGGGAIFHFARATRSLPCRADLLTLEGHVNPPLRGIASDAGFDYLEASGADELRRVLPSFLSTQTSRPAILRLITSGETDAAVYRQLCSPKR